jgi:hypothetical protein
VLEILEKAEKELIAIRALCDVITVTDCAELERNTLPALGALIRDAGQKLYEYVKELSAAGCKEKEESI